MFKGWLGSFINCKSTFRLAAFLLVVLGVSFASKAKSLDKPSLMMDKPIVLQDTGSQLITKGTPNRLYRLFRALANFRPRRFKAASTEFSLDKNGMRHILTRHHPDYWDGTMKTKQTFFRRNMTVNEITDAIESVVRQNREKLHRIGLRGKDNDISGVFKGVKYRLGVDRGRIGQFYPEH